MKKYTLGILSLFIYTNANAFNLNDLNPFAKTEDNKVQTVTMPSAEELKAQAAANSITSYMENNDILNISSEQKQMLKSSYDYIKAQEITNPQVKAVTDKAIKLIDDSGIFAESNSLLDKVLN